jgi:hypothetical protein
MMVLLVGCAPAPEAIGPTKTPGPPTYEITKGTILFAEPDIDARTLKKLSIGEHLIPADGRTEPECTTMAWAGEDVEVCKLTVVMDLEGKTKDGWVLRQWLQLRE